MNETAALELHLPQFDGPLDLLLHLIQKNEMDIHDIPIAEITDQYLRYIDLMEALDLDVASEYLVMASTLLYMKSQSMLPSAKPTRGGQSASEMREQLVKQLLEYKRFKEASYYLHRAEMKRAKVFSREPDPGFSDNATREFEVHATLFDLLTAFQRVLTHVEELPPDFPDDIQDEPITVEQKMREILNDLDANERIEFGTFFTRFQSKIEVICTFLAILELTRLTQTYATQDEPQGVITIELNPNRPDITMLEWTTYDELATVETDH